MQIVIDIPNWLYNAIMECKEPHYSKSLGDAVRDGTPLPKGHGRLKDTDALEPDSCGEWNGLYVTEDTYKQSTIDNAPTIIEADKAEGSDKVNCDKTECYNCVNHGYCDYEPQESEE